MIVGRRTITIPMQLPGTRTSSPYVWRKRPFRVWLRWHLSGQKSLVSGFHWRPEVSEVSTKHRLSFQGRCYRSEWSVHGIGSYPQGRADAGVDAHWCLQLSYLAFFDSLTRRAQFARRYARQPPQPTSGIEKSQTLLRLNCSPSVIWDNFIEEVGQRGRCGP